MDIDDFTDEFFANPPPLSPLTEASFNVLNALSDVMTSPSLSEAVSELHLQLAEQYVQGRRVIDDGISELRELHEQELSSLLATAGKDVAVVHSDTMESVIMRQKREIDGALAEREHLRAALEKELRHEFIRFISVSASGLDGALGDFPKCASSLISFGVSEPCSTVKIPNPLRGVLVGARPKDPALSAIVLDVSHLNSLTPMLALGSAERHREHLKRIVSHRHSVLFLTDSSFMLPSDLPELIMGPSSIDNCMPMRMGLESRGDTGMEGLALKCCTNLWGANVVMRPIVPLGGGKRTPVAVDVFRRIISFAIATSTDMLSFAFGRDHLETELLAMIEAIAATQIDIGASRLTNAWTVSLAAVNSGQSDTIQNQPVYSAHKVAFNLPITIRVFVPQISHAKSDMGEIKRFFHRVLEGRGLEWTGE